MTIGFGFHSLLSDERQPGEKSQRGKKSLRNIS